VAITLKLPPRTVERLRKYARGSDLTMGTIVTDALEEFLRKRKARG
jgi:predicted transcriptional regulator